MARAGAAAAAAGTGPGAAAGGGGAAGAAAEELSLEEVLKAYEQPVNEEQAWAVCFQCCRGLLQPDPPGAEEGRRRRRGPAGRLRDTADLRLHKDGAVSARGEFGQAELPLTLAPAAEAQMVQSLGFVIYRALDWGLEENEERELSPELERLIDLMTNGDSEDSGNGSSTADEGYSGQEEEEEAVAKGTLSAVRMFSQVMQLCAARLSQPQEAHAHYQAVCRALFLETVELKAFLAKIRDAKEMLVKLKDEELRDQSAAELDNLRNTDWARLWVQLMRELRNGVKLKKVQQKQFDPLPTEYQLTPFEMLMQDIRARNYKLRKVMVDGDIPPRVKKDAHELILDFIRSRPPLRQASERRLRPLPQQQRTLHEKILEEIKQERKLRPVELQHQDQRGFGSLPCLVNACSSNMKSTSCINLSVSESGAPPQRQRPRVLLKAPTLAEMEEMFVSEEEDSPCSEAVQEPGPLMPLKRDRSFSEQDLAHFRDESESSEPHLEYLRPSLSDSRPRSGTMSSAWASMENMGSVPARYHPRVSSCPRKQDILGSVEENLEASSVPVTDASLKYLWLQEFSHPVESLALTVEEMINVRRVLVKAEMEKFLQSKELYTSLKKGKSCCCCRTKFTLFSWPPTCLFCKRSVCSSCSLKIKMPSKKLAHIPVYALGFETLHGSLGAKGPPARRQETFQSLQGTRWRSVEEEFPCIYAHGSVLKDVCRDCSGFVTDVVSSSRKSMDILNTKPGRSRKTQSLYISSS
ncbi:protein spire homolog 2 isoform X1 [Pantherophis guttatus]|uniref:Protein spire homolog 2 isoform X1 n=2 Tax=Pantherophis guttatus TaxID=94885 RepID=A0A6P9CHW1_PANGU|nr:protein spire homolog 2 isoform X1 [Pantherophis guttatus]XP_060538437.1 protein spire homolog 2 isoform X1 [Pantherophis guttatus]